MEVRFAGGLARGIASLLQILPIHKGGSGKHDSMVQEQADLTIQALSTVDDAEELVQIHERHVRVDILHIGLEQGVLQAGIGQGEGPLGVQVGHIFRGHLGGQRSHKRRQVDARIGRIERVDELSGSGVAAERLLEEASLAQQAAPRRDWVCVGRLNVYSRLGCFMTISSMLI